MVRFFQWSAVTLSAFSTLLLIYSFQLPQYGDSAIGTFIVFLCALIAYVGTLLIGIPMLVAAFVGKVILPSKPALVAAIAIPPTLWAAVVAFGEAQL